MEQNYVKRFLTKDGNERVTIYQEEYAENPRDMTDEPLHCEDWSRDYTIMNKNERESKSHDALGLIRYLLERYGNTKAIIEILRNNAKAEKHEEDDDALVYDASRHEWILKCWIGGWRDYSGEMHGNCWSEEVSWACKLKNLEASDIVPYLSDGMIDIFADERFLTDGIKIGSYSFGYHGGISFCDSFSVDSEGICWLEKDEFLKYSGCKEEYWKDKTLREIEFLLNELEAWGDNDVYGFVVEKRRRFKLHKEYIDEDIEDEDYEDEEWDETDSCWGYYGDIWKKENLENIISEAGFKLEELDEVA